MSHVKLFAGMTLNDALSMGKNQKWYNKIDKSGDGVISQDEIFNYQKKEKIKHAVIGTGLLAASAILFTVAMKSKPVSFTNAEPLNNLPTVTTPPKMNSVSNSWEFKYMTENLKYSGMKKSAELLETNIMRQNERYFATFEKIEKERQKLFDITKQLSSSKPINNTVKLNMSELLTKTICAAPASAAFGMGIFELSQCAAQE